MWQLLSIGALFSEKLQDAIDKYAIVNSSRLDEVCASFWRMLLYTALLCAIISTGLFGAVSVVGTMPLFVVGILWTITSVFYTRLLRDIEVSAIGTLSYVGPFLFLLIDMFLLHQSLTLWQVTGVLLLVSGSLLFVINPKTLKIRNQFSLQIWLIFLFNIFILGYESYLFQFYQRTQGMSEATFLLSGCVLSLLCFIVLAFLQGKMPLLFKRQHLQYAKRAAVSKCFDALQSLLWFAAIAGATVSQVTAMGAYSPIVLLLIVWIFQKYLHLNVNENLDRRLFVQKLVATVILAIGGILIA